MGECRILLRHSDTSASPETKSRWAQMARTGSEVMEFLSEGRYVANVIDGNVNLYGGRARTSK